MALARRAAAKGISGMASAPAESANSYWSSLPSVIEFLSLVRWDDGTSRVPGTMMLLWESGFWKCWLHDRDALEGAFLSAGTLQELLEKVEEAVSLGNADWRPDKKVGKKGG